MPVIVNCPSCSGALRVADDLIGRKVRCPSCQTIFDAAAPSGGGNDLPLETQPIDSWKNLDLELSRNPDPAPAPAPAPSATPRQGLVGAIEVESGPQDPPRRLSHDEEREPDRRDEGDLRPCPGCGKLLNADSTRCFACGARLMPGGRSSRRDDYDYMPTRRDCEPHRGTPILVLGILSLVSLTLTSCLPVVVNLLGVVMGVIAWWMGQGDLSKMKSGTMDPDGHGTTMAGWVCGICGTFLNLLIALGCGAFIGLMFYSEYQQNQQRQQPPGFKQPNQGPGMPKDKW